MSYLEFGLKLLAFFCFIFGVGLFRRGHRHVGVALTTLCAVAAILLLVVWGEWIAPVALFGVSAADFGFQIDRPGSPLRRALGLLGISIGVLALLAVVSVRYSG